MTTDSRTRLVIAGGGVAALELVLALRGHAAGDHVHVTLVAPSDVLQPGYDALRDALSGTTHALDLAPLGYALEFDLVTSRVVSVDDPAGRVELDDGTFLSYDELVIAAGARRDPLADPAVTFGLGAPDPVRHLLTGLQDGSTGNVVIAAGPACGWTLPAYELALAVARHPGGRQVTIASSEPEPLAVFPGAGSRAVAALLADAGIRFFGGCRDFRRTADGVVRYPGSVLMTGDIVTLPELRGPGIAGLPADERGFVCAGPAFDVPSLPGVHVIGDAASSPVKQGGLAAQQAHTVAAGIARRAGVPAVPPTPYRGVLHTTLVHGPAPGDRQYLSARLRAGTATCSDVARTAPPWAVGALAAPYLGPLLERLPRDGLVTAIGALPTPDAAPVAELHTPVTPAGRLVPVR